MCVMSVRGGVARSGPGDRPTGATPRFRVGDKCRKQCRGSMSGGGSGLGPVTPGVQCRGPKPATVSPTRCCSRLCPVN